MKSPEVQYRLLPFYLVFIVLTFLAKDHIFFWDTVQLGSMQAHHFFENGLDNSLLPDRIDSGHIPFFGMYIAMFWKVLGRELWVSHFAMLPFLLGIVWQLFVLVRHFLPQRYVFYALLLLIAEPTLLAQSVLVSPDIVLVFFFLLVFNSVLKNNRFLLVIGIAGLFLISLRGLMVAFSLLLFDIYLNAWKAKKLTTYKLLQMSLAYWPAVLVILPYFLFHYIEKGWIAYHPDSPWMLSFEKVDFRGFLYNIGIMGWRILDFGRIFPILLIIVITLTRVGRIKFYDKFRYLIVFSGILLLCLGYSFTTYKYLSAHRYLLPLYMLLILAFAYMLFSFVHYGTLRKVFYFLALGGLLSGHLWIYPEGISQGWDASLAHWPYYELRDEMNNYLEKEGIDYSNVAAEFPNTSERRFMELNESQERHQGLNLDSNQYVLYSNIYNNINDQEIKRIKNEFELVKSFEKQGVFIELRIKELRN